MAGVPLHGGASRPLIKHLGLAPYEPTWRAMQKFTDERDTGTPDEIWFVEHPPVFTLGLNASRDHLLAPGDIPVVQIDRGGQVTYHGPGQLVIYPLIDIRRLGMGVRQLVVALENAIIDTVAEFGVTAEPFEVWLQHFKASGTVSDTLWVHEHTRPVGMVLDVRVQSMPDGRVVRTYTDITTRKRNEAVLRAALEEADQATRAKSAFQSATGILTSVSIALSVDKFFLC